MKIFALGSFTKPLTDEQRKQIMSKEVPDTLKLYLDGKIDNSGSARTSLAWSSF